MQLLEIQCSSKWYLLADGERELIEIVLKKKKKVPEMHMFLVCLLLLFSKSPKHIAFVLFIIYNFISGGRPR
jgi:hypothetical protein